MSKSYKKRPYRDTIVNTKNKKEYKGVRKKIREIVKNFDFRDKDQKERMEE
jgi:hypothetical protein